MMKFPKYDPKVIEESILKFWQEQQIVEKLRKRNKGKQKFYFLEGPPYTSGRIHLGHAWNIALKDIVLRYKRMQGLDVWDRMGYDMHGLPTEQKTMKKLGLKNKEEIEKFGLARFTKECHKFCTEMMGHMNKDFQRVGASLDFTDPYQPISHKFMEAEWWLIKEAYKKGRLYQGLRTMHWDAATQTAVAKHELEYKNIKDTSIYVKLQTQEHDKSFFIIWTTTPWTIPLNLAVMVNPELDYVDIKVGEEIWTVAKALHKQLLTKAKVKDGEYKILRSFKGTELEGKKYFHPLKIQKHLPEELRSNPKLFSILLSKEYVDDSAGTGLVHCAPGCGPEDYEVGHLNHIPPFNCVDETGYFRDLGEFSGLKAKTDDQKFIDAIDQAGALLAKESYTHDYPHGERSHEPVIFRTTKQWFFKVEDLKEKMLAANEEIMWNPKGAKHAFRSWLENLRDNSITKQRYWGTPVPIWKNVDDEDDVLVIGSLKELEELSGQKVTDMHIPAIDEITIQKENKTYKRVPDVLDVWIDAGTASWNCLDYPTNKELFERLFPADFILEGKDQIRGWFNLLMVASFLGFDLPSFKNVYMNGFVTDVGGEKMSKSLGNVISPYDVIEKHSADIMRYYMCQTNAGEDINFSWDELTVKGRNLNIVWNVQNLLLNLARENELLHPFALDKESFQERAGAEEKYIISRLHSTIKEVTALLEAYKIDRIIAPIEQLFLELSRTYIQMSRDRMALGSKEEKELAAYTIGTVLLETLKMFHTVVPFLTEAIYLNLKDAFALEQESISHYDWPVADETLINAELEEQMHHLSAIMQAALNGREKAKLGLRWPVAEVVVVSKDEKLRLAAEQLSEILKTQLNAKKITVTTALTGMKESYEANYGKIGPVCGKQTAKVVEAIKGMSAEKLSAALQEKGKLSLEIEGENYEITADMLNVSREEPENYAGSNFKAGQVYVNKEQDQKLLAEGYARELMRKVQNMRKNAGLEKADRIKLHIQCSHLLHADLVSFTRDIADKVGAEHIEISVNAAAGTFKNQEEAKIKEEKFVLSF